MAQAEIASRRRVLECYRVAAGNPPKTGCLSIHRGTATPPGQQQTEHHPGRTPPGNDARCTHRVGACADLGMLASFSRANRVSPVNGMLSCGTASSCGLLGAGVRLAEHRGDAGGIGVGYGIEVARWPAAPCYPAVQRVRHGDEETRMSEKRDMPRSQVTWCWSRVVMRDRRLVLDPRPASGPAAVQRILLGFGKHAAMATPSVMS